MVPRNHSNRRNQVMVQRHSNQHSRDMARRKPVGNRLMHRIKHIAGNHKAKHLTVGNNLLVSLHMRRMGRPQTRHLMGSQSLGRHMVRHSSHKLQKRK